MCRKQNAFLPYNYYMTYSEEEGFFISTSYYYDASALKKSASLPNFIELPSNISELNDYMCGSANRKGFLCSECIDGFGPSATSPKFKCSNCSNTFARYSVVIYLLSELVPVVIFYFIVLFFPINLTSVPMVSFVLYCQIVHNVISYNLVDMQVKYFLLIASVFHGIWNLTFFRYVIPPFCISPKLRMIHIIYLQSISTIFPFFLIAITWICIELYTRNCVLLVYLWRAFNNLVPKCIKVMQTPTRTVINAFTTFFLLSYTKLIFVLVVPIFSVKVYNIKLNDTVTTLSSSYAYRLALDPSGEFSDKSHHIAIKAISILIFLSFILPPVVILALYPIRAFRNLLFKCCSSRCMASLTIFVEKFYSCYRDGLDGGRDMRSLAALPFFAVLLGFALNNLVSLFFAFCVYWCLTIAIVQPYKKKFMAISDVFIIANASILLVILFNVNSSNLYIFPHAFRAFGTLPMLWLVSFVFFKVFETKLKTQLNMIKEKLPCCNYLLNRIQNKEDYDAQQIEDFNALPDADRMLHPERYKQQGYDSLS